MPCITTFRHSLLHARHLRMPPREVSWSPRASPSHVVPLVLSAIPPPSSSHDEHRHLPTPLPCPHPPHQCQSIPLENALPAAHSPQNADSQAPAAREAAHHSHDMSPFPSPRQSSRSRSPERSPSIVQQPWAWQRLLHCARSSVLALRSLEIQPARPTSGLPVLLLEKQ